MDDVRIEDVDPRNPGAQWALTAYVDEVRAAAGLAALDVDAALRDVDGFLDPRGFFLVAACADEVVGCIGVRPHTAQDAEIKRMWVAADRRGAGLAVELLDETEQRAAALGYSRIVLDTNGALTAALRFYARHGYRSIERYNDNPDATHFFAKDLV